jgi:hypothetical protein
MNARSESGSLRKLAQREAYNSTMLAPPPVDPTAASSEASTNCQALDSGRVHDLVLGSRDPTAHQLAREIYRLHSLVRRAALLVHTIQERTGGEVLDITSRTLFLGLARALEHEPAVVDRRAWATCLASGTRSAEVAKPPAPSKPAAAVPAAERSPRREAIPDGRRQRLFTWKLIPEPGRPNIGWSASPYRGIAIVRALDPVQARALAVNKFAPAAGSFPGERNPWARKSLVRCELFEDATYDHVHAAGVVYP